MKVLFITNIPSPYRVDFFNELGKHVELTVLFETQVAKDRKEAWLAHDFRNFSGIFLKGIQMRSDDAFCPSVLPYLSRKKFDIIVLGGYGTPTCALSILYMRAFRIPFVLNLDGGFIREESKLKRNIKKFFISSASWWICSGNYTKATLKYYGAEEDKIFTYPFTSIRQSDILARPPSKKEKQELKNELGMKEEKIILSVGQFIPRKGFDLLIKASKNIPKNVGVYIVGGKPPQEYLDLAKDFNVEERVHFVDFKLKNELKKYYMAADLFVLPTREDVWGLVINEAMAHGLCVITTNRCIAGLELIEDGKGGFIVEVENVEKLSSAINAALEDEHLMMKMSERNLIKIREHTIENMVKTHLEIFDKIK